MGPQDPFARATAALVLPGAANAFLLSDSLRVATGSYAVTWRGSFAGEPMPAGRFGRPYPGSPIIVWRARGTRAVWRATIAPVSMAHADETQLLASVELTAEPLDRARGLARIEATVSPDSSFPLPNAADQRLSATVWVRGRAGGARMLGAAEQEGAMARATHAAARGRPARWRFVLAGSERFAALASQAARRSHATCMARADREWSEVIAGATRMSVGDPALEQAADEALLVLMGCTERRGSGLRGIGSPFQYRDTWIRDAARQASALSQWGLADPAREIAADLLEFQGEAGDFMSQPGQLDGTGEAMWALGETYGRSPSSAVPDSIARALARAWRWCERQRARVRERAPEHAALMPPADPHDNELAAGYLFGTDAWTLAGYVAAGSLLERAGQAPCADSLRRSAAGYAADLRARLRRANGILPARWDGPARNWGNLAALVPTGAISLAEAHRARLLSAIDGVPSGLATYGTSDTAHLYLGSDLAVDALLMGRADVWRASLSASLASRTGTGGAPELYCRSTRSFGWNLPPHATSAAAFLVQLRQGLVFDALGDTLRLTLGTLPEWWRAGSRLERAPTRWGVVDLAFAWNGNRAEWRWTPVAVWTEVSLPPGARMVGEPTAGRIKDASRILVPPGQGRLEVACAFE